MTKTTTPHTITLRIDHDFGIRHTFACSAPAGAPCRLVCPDGCDEFNLTTHVADTLGDDREWLMPLTTEEHDDLVRRHTLVDSGECNFLTFLENDEAELWELYDGDTTEARSGPVDLSYGDGDVTWAYARPADTPALAEAG